MLWVNCKWLLKMFLSEIYRPQNMCHPTKQIIAVMNEQEDTVAGIIFDSNPSDEPPSSSPSSSQLTLFQSWERSVVVVFVVLSQFEDSELVRLRLGDRTGMAVKAEAAWVSLWDEANHDKFEMRSGIAFVVCAGDAAVSELSLLCLFIDEPRTLRGAVVVNVATAAEPLDWACWDLSLCFLAAIWSLVRSAWSWMRRTSTSFWSSGMVNGTAMVANWIT